MSQLPLNIAAPSPVTLTALPSRAWAQSILLHYKPLADLTFAAIATHLGLGEVWVTSAIFQQQLMSADEADKLVSFLKLPQDLATTVWYLLQQPVTIHSNMQSALLLRCHALLATASTLIHICPLVLPCVVGIRCRRVTCHLKPSPPTRVTIVCTRYYSVRQLLRRARVSHHSSQTRSITPPSVLFHLPKRPHSISSVLSALVCGLFSNEKFGAGIMSAIDFQMSVDKVKGQQGEDRVRVELNGKFLPYKRW